MTTYIHIVLMLHYSYCYYNREPLSARATRVHQKGAARNTAPTTQPQHNNHRQRPSPIFASTFVFDCSNYFYFSFYTFHHGRCKSRMPWKASEDGWRCQKRRQCCTTGWHGTAGRRPTVAYVEARRGTVGRLWMAYHMAADDCGWLSLNRHLS